MLHPDESEDPTLGTMGAAVKWRRDHPSGLTGCPLRLDEAEWQSAVRQIERRERER